MDIPLIIYIAWAVVVFTLSFLHSGLSADAVTHILILIFAAVQIPLFTFCFKNRPVAQPQILFIGLSSAFAAIVEGCYMLSKPVGSSLLVTAGMSASHILRNYAIDLAFTLPVYIPVFWVIWKFINIYRYETWQFLIFMSLGQAIADGFAFFIAAPRMFFFLPYVLINYQSMIVLPFLAVKSTIAPGRNSWMKCVLPPLTVLTIYLILGTLLQVAAHTIGAF